MNNANINIWAGALELLCELLIVGAIFFFIEKLRPAEKQITFIKDDTRQELFLTLINVIIFIPVFTVLITFIFKLIVFPLIPYQLFQNSLTKLPIIVQFFFAAFILDISVYWRHRLTHNYLWRFHAIHHSALHINWLTAMRFHPIDIFVTVLFNTSILYFIGFSSAGVTFAIVILKAYNYFTHANLNLQFDKPMRYIFASPNFHRWHHADEVSAYDKNFCSMFSLIDLMFGTYHHPENQLPKAYGIGKDAQKDYPKSFLGQLAYPFRKKK